MEIHFVLKICKSTLEYSKVQIYLALINFPKTFYKIEKAKYLQSPLAGPSRDAIPTRMSHLLSGVTAVTRRMNLVRIKTGSAHFISVFSN